MVYKFGVLLLLLLVVVHLNRSCAAKLPTGTGPSNQLSRIAHGWEASILEYSYMVNIWKKSASGKSRIFYCGGTLISETCILTAAHCVFDKVNHRLFPSENFEFYGGNNTREKGILLPEVESILIDDYNPYTSDMDVAIIKLTEPVEDFNMKTVEIDYSEVNDGDIITVAGWGQTDTIDSPENLRETYYSVISTEECKQYYGSYITENTFCVRGFQNAGQCNGDSGGPIIRNGKQIGIVSFSRDLPCGENGYPRVEAKLSSSRVSRFLRQTIANKC